MAHPAAITRRLAFLVAVLAPAIAAACPNCTVGNAKLADTRILLGIMIVLPLVLAAVVIVIIRRTLRSFAPPAPEKATGATVASDGSPTAL